MSLQEVTCLILIWDPNLHLKIIHYNGNESTFAETISITLTWYQSTRLQMERNSKKDYSSPFNAKYQIHVAKTLYRKYIIWYMTGHDKERKDMWKECKQCWPRDINRVRSIPIRGIILGAIYTHHEQKVVKINQQ